MLRLTALGPRLRGDDEGVGIWDGSDIFHATPHEPSDGLERPMKAEAASSRPTARTGLRIRFEPVRFARRTAARSVSEDRKPGGA